MPSIASLLPALLATIVIEGGVLVLLRERRMTLLLASAAVNIATNVPLNLYVTCVDGSLYTIVVAELLVILAEAACYWLVVRSLSQAFTYSVLCNAISFLSGLLFLLLADAYTIYSS